jgi:hypothetical protein
MTSIMQRVHKKIYCKNLNGGHHLEGTGVNGRVTIKYTFNKYGVKRVDCSVKGPVAFLHAHGK